jgi:hypothetical protein
MSHAGQGSTPTQASWLRRLYRPIVVATAAAVVLVSLCLPKLFSWAPDLSRRAEYRLTPAQVAITPPPHWVPHDLVGQVFERADLPREMSVLDADLTRNLAQAFRMHPWVEEVVSVQAKFPAAVTVQLAYRTPVAMVQVRQGLYPIDRQGVLLPPHDFSLAATRQFVFVSGVNSTPQGPAGTEWGDPVVVGAANLAEYLLPVWKKFRLTAIECPKTMEPPNDLDAGVFVLAAVGGTRIVWGQAPSSDHPGELDTEQKLGRLEEYITRFGGFDKPHGPYRIDIRHWRDISRTPLSAEQESRESMRE